MIATVLAFADCTATKKGKKQIHRYKTEMHSHICSSMHEAFLLLPSFQSQVSSFMKTFSSPCLCSIVGRQGEIDGTTYSTHDVHTHVHSTHHERERERQGQAN
jgi:hypothetical protein